MGGSSHSRNSRRLSSAKVGSGDDEGPCNDAERRGLVDRWLQQWSAGRSCLPIVGHDVRNAGGEVPEWLNGAVSKTVSLLTGARGFESPPLRQEAGRWLHRRPFSLLIPSSGRRRAHPRQYRGPATGSPARLPRGGWWSPAAAGRAYSIKDSICADRIWSISRVNPTFLKRMRPVLSIRNTVGKPSIS